MRLRAHHKLFLSYSLLVTAVVAILMIGVDATLRRPLLEQAADELLRELALGREIYETEPRAGVDDVARRLGRLTGHRVTIIAADGAVIGDSGVEPGTVAALENHAARPEVRAALETGVGTAVRHSASVGVELLYAARLTERGHVIRFAVGIESVDTAVAGVRRQVLLVGAVALLLAALLSLGFSIVVTRPLRRLHSIAGTMADGDLSVRVRPERRDELGELGTMLDSLADELQRRLGQLEAEREEMRALIDAMAEGVLAIAADGTLVRANPAFHEMFGLSAAPPGSPPEAIARRRPFLEVVRRVLAGEPVPPTELSHDDRQLLATAQPLPRGGAVLVFLDVSELRRLEGVRRDFVANASHELKTPLTAIRGYSETLLQEDLSAELRHKFAATIHTHAERLQGILDDLLDLSKIESGAWTVRPETVALDALARDTWQPFTARAAECGVTFRTDIAADRARITADPGALSQILSNLFSNALRYTPAGGSITLSAAAMPDDGVRIAVRDTGSGIPAPHLGRIFERFYRVDPARSRAEGGTGLGLAIVRHLVERHGGTIGVESEVGRGTTIHFTLPGAAATA